MAKNEGQTPDTEGTMDRDGGDVTVVGQGSGGVVRDTPTVEVRESADAPVEGYKLTKLKEEEVVTPGLVELEVVADGTFMSSTGDLLKTGDRKLVSTVDAAALLDAKVNGKSAFKQV